MVDVGASIVKVVVGVFQTHGAVGLAEALHETHKGAPDAAGGAQPVLLGDAVGFCFRLLRAWRGSANKKILRTKKIYNVRQCKKNFNFLRWTIPYYAPK